MVIVLVFDQNKKFHEFTYFKQCNLYLYGIKTNEVPILSILGYPILAASL